MKFNEDARVKIPSILHLMQLGCTYLSLKDTYWDISTNIFTGIFYGQLKKINKTLSQKEAKRF
jgi:type I restriction enzyme R subunit